MTNRRLATITMVALALVLAPSAAGQGTLPQSTTDPGILDGSKQRELDGARKTWKAAHVRSYSYAVALSCFCPPSKAVKIVVRNGRPRAATPKSLAGVATVPRLFRTIQRAIDRKVARIGVTYGKRGVPSSIAIDISSQIADEESYYTIRHFTVLRQRAG
jgi:hypothetical protein